MKPPTDRRYTPSHEWALPRDGLMLIGITQHAADALTDVTYVSLPKPGTVLHAGKEFGEIESVKATSALYAPVGGEVVEANASLNDDPAKVNNDPHETGWMLKLKPADPAEYEKLLTPEAYAKTLG